MYLKLLKLFNLIAFAFLASQPLFYLLALARSQKRLGASSYIELRKVLDKNLNRNLKLLYYFTLLSALLLAIVACALSHFLHFITASIAVMALVADILIALKRNIPINNLINTWEKDAYPRHWQLIRRKWFYFYHIR